jgi:hypothetical protein
VSITNDEIVLDAGLDWITQTSQHPDTSIEMDMLARNLLLEEEQLGEIDQPWHMQGYRGRKCGAVKAGARHPMESILIISGERADHYKHIFRVEKSRITRLDLQVTLRLGRSVRNAAFDLYRGLEGIKERGGIQASIRYISSESGDTLYVGKRSGGVMLRFYDKSLDYGETERGRVWRYEVEYGRNAAGPAWEKIAGFDPWPERAAGMVAAEYKKRGIAPRFHSNSSITAIEVLRSVTTADRKIEWLRKCVAPVITQLVLLGYEEQVFQALSLTGIRNKEKELWQSTKPITPSGGSNIPPQQTQ